MPKRDDIQVRQLVIEINGGCNYKCPMCPQATGREKSFLRKLPFDVFTKVVDDAEQYGLEVVSLHGSGEPTLNKDMAKYVAYVKAKGLQCISLTNGYKLAPEMSESLITAGIDMVRVSAVGYDRETYEKWMSRDAYDLVREHVIKFREINERLGGTSEIQLYHLITDIDALEFELEQYKQNWVEKTGAQAEIWTMHNWSGSYEDAPYNRKLGKLKGCGRPNSPSLYVRAGGTDKRQAAVTPCCFVLGRDSEAVLGHLDTNSIADVVKGDAFEQVRNLHDEGRVDEINYCKDCDQLYESPESLVWSNIPGKSYNQAKHLKDYFFADFA